MSHQAVAVNPPSLSRSMRTASISQLLAEWSGPGPFDAAAILEQHPEIHGQQSLVVDLAYEEFCQRVEAGEAVDFASFVARFPSIRHSLYKLLEVHQLLADNPQLWNHTPAPLWPNVGDVFLNFELLEELGQGAFSRVYLAKERDLGNRLVAVKLSAQLGHEASILGQLDHPNIIQVNSIQQDEQSGLTALCMPFRGRVTLLNILDCLFAKEPPPDRARCLLEALRTVAPSETPAPGESASPLLRNGSYAEGVLSLAIALTDALAAAHARGIFHCDLKPSNILLTAAGQPLLLDFNLSTSARLPGSNFGGTLPYMAPEQLEAIRRSDGHLLPVDARTDLFSLGVLLSEMLSGQLPFGSPSEGAPGNCREVAAALLSRQEAGPAPLPESLAVPSELKDLIARCLAFRPEDRPHNAEALCRELRRLTSWRSRTWRWMRLHRRAVASLALCFAVLFGAIAVRVVTREPYVVRHANAAWQAYREQEYTKAAELFTEVLQFDAGALDARFGRARARQQLGEWELAFEDFQKLSQETKDGRVTACLALCASHLDAHHLITVSRYRLAAEQGFSSAATRNNLGYALFHQDQFEEAEQSFREAMRQDPHLPVPFHNMARLNFRATARDNTDPDPYWVEEALRLGGDSAELHLDAATVYATLASNGNGAAADRKARQTHVIDHCRRAVEQGLNPARLRFLASILPDLWDQPEFQQWLARPAPTGPAPDSVLLVDPLYNQGERLSFR